jgi:hypothetical protein
MSGRPDTYPEWLSGECFYAEPPPWAFKMRDGDVRLMPSWGLLFTICAFGGFCCAFAGVLFWIPDDSWMRFGRYGIGAFVGIVGVVAFGPMLVQSLRDHARGPYLIYSLQNGSISLPRENVCILKQNAIAWRLVSGNHVGPEGHQKKREKPMWELQLIAETATGNMTYVVGGGMYAASRRAVDELVKSTGIPLEVVEQHQGISRPPPSKHTSWRDS